MEARGQAWLPSGALPVSTVLSSLGRLQHQPGAASWAEGWGKEKSLSQNRFPMTCFPTIFADPTGNSKEGGISDESIRMSTHRVQSLPMDSRENLDCKLQQTHTMRKIKSLTARPQLAASLFISHNATKTMHRFSKMSFLRFYQLVTYYFISKL